MGRSACCSKVGLRRGPWSAKEDSLLSSFIEQHGEGQWRSLPKRAGLLRCGKSCRLRWMNYLRPGIKRGNISEDEEDLIVRLHALLGNRWSLIAGRLPGRTDNEIKNYWNTHLCKKIKNQKPTSHTKNNKSSEMNEGEEDIKPTTLYLPKPLRLVPSISPPTQSSDGEPTPVFELEEPPMLYPYTDSVSGDFHLWEEVWEEVYAECMRLF